MVDQKNIHTKCLSDDLKERIHALDQLEEFFSSMPDKQQAWNDLHKLTNDENSDVRYRAAYTLGSTFSYIPDKQQAWNDLHKLTNDKDRYVRYSAACALDVAFSHIPDKQQAWNDLHRLIFDKDSDVRYRATYAIGSTFSFIPDKQQAWSILYRPAIEKNWHERKQEITLLISTFSHMPDNQQAWDDLIKMTRSENNYVRSDAVSSLVSSLSQVSDKKLAWNFLIRLTNEEDSYVRTVAASHLSSTFSQMPDKQQAWDDLHKLTKDADSDVRYWAISSLCSSFSLVPDKQQFWDDLTRLTNDEDNYVRTVAASYLGSTFPFVSDKQQAWNDLIKLKDHEDNYVRTFANYSLGRASIFNASQQGTDEDYRKELEKAIEFFENASLESPRGSNPSKFCLPFYRSFHTIVFKKQEAEEEVEKYLKEAKATIEKSKGKELLLEAIENLAEALKEVQNLENLNLEAKKGELNFYRQYCDRAAELMIKTEEIAPFATEILKKGLPILDKNLKEILKEIQKKAKIACEESVGTATEEIARTIIREVKKWEIGNQEEMSLNIENLIFTLKSNIPRAPENQFIFNRIQEVREQKDLAKQYGIVCAIIPLIPRLNMEREICKIEKAIGEVDEKTNTIIVKLDEIKELRSAVDRLTASIDELQNPQQYIDIIQRDLKEIKDYMPGMKEKIDEVLYELFSPLSTTQKLKVAIPIIPSVVSYEFETDIPRLVADRIDELKNLVLRFKH